MKFRPLSFAFAALVVIVMFPVLAQAADSAAKPTLVKATTSSTPLATAATNASVAEAAVFESKINTWNSRMDDAKGKKSFGKKVFLGGLCGGALLSALNTKSSNGSSGAKWMVLGAGVAGYGGYTMWKASEAISDLDREAMINGYYKVRVGDGLTIAPSDTGGIQARLALSF